MSHELLVFPEALERCKFLADITGLPIRQSKLFPELNSFSGDPRISEFPFSFELSLGDLPDRYDIGIDISLASNRALGNWQPHICWRVAYNNHSLYPELLWSHSGGLNQGELKEEEKVKELLLKKLDGAIGGPDTEVAFMDYENYTSAGLQDKDSYFANIYLVMMVNMRERGLQMAPILSRRPEIAKAMKFGDVATVKEILGNIAAFEAPSYDPRSRSHINYESAVIMDHAQHEHRHRDPRIPLSESFKNLDIVRIEEGSQSLGPKNILVVENDLDSYGFFRDKVINSLTRDGNYKESSVITDFNLSSCMQLCRTGKIDFVVFDWCTPSDWEALMCKPQRDPLFDLFHGSGTHAAIEFEDGKMQAIMPDGKVFDKEKIRQKSEDLDIRSKWMNMIASACRTNGVAVPRHFIVRDSRDIEKLGRVILLYLNK